MWKPYSMPKSPTAFRSRLRAGRRVATSCRGTRRSRTKPAPTTLKTGLTARGVGSQQSGARSQPLGQTLQRALCRGKRARPSPARPVSRPVVLHVVIRPKTDPILDEQGGRIGNFELKPIVSDISGREVAEFGTVRPRVQIPGPRPKIVFN